MVLKILIYILYVTVFSYCYFILNRKISNKWILIGYPLFFVLSIYPAKLWFEYVRPIYNEAFVDTWLKIILMSIGGFTLFNFCYGIVNLMVDTQVGFHRRYGKPDLNPVKFVINNAGNIKTSYHLFFYSGAILTSGVVFYTY